MVCMVDEAHHLLPKRDSPRESVLETCLREGREVGLGIILASQAIAAISPIALANCFTTVVLNCRQRSEVSAAANTLLLPDDARFMLSTLPVGQAVARLSDRWPLAVHIEAPNVEIPKGSVTDDDIREVFLTGPLARGSREHAATGDSADPASSAPEREHPRVSPVVPVVPARQHTGGSSSPGGTSRIGSDAGYDDRNGDPLTSHPELRVLLEHVAKHPFEPLTSRYRDTGLSRRKGDALKRVLVQLGLVTPTTIPTATGRVLLLGLTDTARAWLLRHHKPITPLHGSLPHAYWQDQATRLLGAAGWAAQQEYRIGEATFDVAADRSDTRVLLNVETGKSAWLKNLDMMDRARAGHKAVVWTDPGSIERARLAVPEGIAILRPVDLSPWIAGLG
jgi:hypothetical protein